MGAISADLGQEEKVIGMTVKVWKPVFDRGTCFVSQPKWVKIPQSRCRAVKQWLHKDKEHLGKSYVSFPSLFLLHQTLKLEACVSPLTFF